MSKDSPDRKPYTWWENDQWVGRQGKSNVTGSICWDIEIIQASHTALSQYICKGIDQSHNSKLNVSRDI